MKRNVGKADRTFRIVAGVIGLGVGYYYQSWLGLIGLVPLLTGVMGWCGLYTLLGVNTCKS